MIDHLSLQCADVGASASFYDAVLAPLGGRRITEDGPAVGFGIPPSTHLLVGSADHRGRLPRVPHRLPGP